MMSDIAGFFEAVDSWIGGFTFISITAVSSVEDVVDDLKSQADTVAVDSNLCEILLRGTAQISADPDACPDQGACFRAMNGFEFAFTGRRNFRLNVQDMSGNHATDTARSTAEHRYDMQHPFGREILR